jgi:1-acyl-sn-glycerol-3-phosphate acyltransferase
MLNAIARWLFLDVFGWRIVGRVPHELPKGLWVVAPHTTNWDFPIGLGVRPTIGIWIEYLGKSSLFTWYSGWLFRALGGRPVYRSKANNLVDAMVDVINKADKIHVCITPEGTRSDVTKLKTGFYYIALKANVPIILTGFDWPNRRVVLGEPIHVTGNYEQDMLPFYEFFSKIPGKKKTWLTNWEKTGVMV